MEHETFENESDNDDVDDEEVPRTPRAAKAAKNGSPGAAARQRNEEGLQQGERAQEARADHDGEGQGLFDLRRGQRAHAGEHRVVRPDGRLAVGLLGRGDRDRRLVVEDQGRKGRERRGRERRGRRRGSRRGRQEGRGRGRGRRRRLLEDQRPGAHVPAQDGVGVAAHPRGRGRDRQADRGRRAARAAGRAQLVGRHRGDPRAGRQAAEAEDSRQGGGQGRRRRGRRVRRAVAHRARLQGDRQDPPALEGAGEGRREAGGQGRLRADAQEVQEADQRSASRRSSTRFRRCASTRSRSTRSC